MSDASPQPAGWYHAEGDPPGTQRYWDGTDWEGEPQPVPTVDGEQGPGSPPVASPLNRSAARVVDAVLWAVILILSSVVAIGRAAFDTTEVSFGKKILTTIIGLGAIALYEIVLVGRSGQTAGKRLFGIRVVRVDGTPATFADAALRISPFVALHLLAALTGSFGQVLSIVPWVLLVISFVFLFTDPLRQAVWDKVSRTIVVDT